MKGTKDLFGEAYARKSDPPTSKRAAERVKQFGMASRSERRVINTIWWPENEDGLISDEICMAIDGNRERWGSLTPRLKPAATKGYIQAKRDAFGLVTRKSKVSGGDQQVHIKGLRRPEWDINEDR